jgi:hypothetical protein
MRPVGAAFYLPCSDHETPEVRPPAKLFSARSMDKKVLGEKLASRWKAQKSKRVYWDTVWDQIADYLAPRKGNIQNESTVTLDLFTNLYNTRIWHANNTLASGQLNYLTPAGEPWFRWQPPRHAANSEKAKQWCNTITEIALEELAISNFYSEIHEFYLDRGGFGTAALYSEEGPEEALAFRSFRVSSYVIDEDKFGRVNTVIFELCLSLDNLVAEFGEENLSDKQQERVAKAKDKPELWGEEVPILLHVYPRSKAEREYGKIDGPNKAIAGIYQEEEQKNVLRVGGYEEMPAFVSRFLRWNNEMYGFSPSFFALPESRSLNLMEKHQDALAELAAFPRVLIPRGMEGEVDLRAAGVTFFDPSSDPGAQPREWATQGRYDIGLDRVMRKEEAIDRLFHVDLFQMLASRPQQKTATEVLELVEEKIVQFSPNFARMTTEVLNPLLARVYGLLWRQGRFPDPPPEMLTTSRAGIMLEVPRVNYISRIALAIKALQNQAYRRFVDLIAPIMDIDPTVVDLLSLERTFKGLAANEALPSDFMATDEEIAQKKEARVAAAQAEMAMQAAEASGKANPEVLNQL